MRLTQLLADCGRVIDGGLLGPDVEINRITADSRQVTAGSLFVACRGLQSDGHRYIDDAIARGAVAIAAERPDILPSVSWFRVRDGQEALAWLAASFYGHPSRTMALAGVAGTDGKTTTANLMYAIMRAAGERVGLISTINAVVGDEALETGLHTTTPDAPDVQRYLAAMVGAGASAAILETTSHGLVQHRVTGCHYDVAVVTNITHEHLDYHGSWTAYRDAKALLFRSLSASARKTGRPKTAVLNRDDPSFEFLAAIPCDQAFVYSTGEAPRVTDGVAAGSIRYLCATGIRQSPSELSFVLRILHADDPMHAQEIRISSPLIGRYNVANILAATGGALALGASQGAVAAGVSSLRGINGRMERIDAGQDFVALVDFAHTPNALGTALETARGLRDEGGQVIAVFGCAGLRDREKRSLMGIVAAGGADYTVITAEDPRTEDLEGIMEETATALRSQGRVAGQDYIKVGDRQRAIMCAVQRARPGDVVIVCGKGHEKSMCFGAHEHPWSDQEALRWALRASRSGGTAEPPHLLPTWSTGGS